MYIYYVILITRIWSSTTGTFYLKTTVFPFQWHKNKYRNQDSKCVCVFVVCLVVVVYHHGYNEIVKRECMICFSTHHIIAWFCRTSVLQFDQKTAINAQDRGLREPHWRPLFGPKTHFKESRVLTHSTHRRTICLSTSDMGRKTFCAVRLHPFWKTQQWSLCILIKENHLESPVIIFPRRRNSTRIKTPDMCYDNLQQIYTVLSH